MTGVSVNLHVKSKYGGVGEDKTGGSDDDEDKEKEGVEVRVTTGVSEGDVGS